MLREPIPEQGSVLDNASQPMYPTVFAMLLQVVNLACQPPTVDEAESGANKKKDWVIPTLVPFSESCLERVVDLYQVCVGNESVIQDHVFYSIVKVGLVRFLCYRNF
jgi:hypothetical protein